MLNLSKKVNSFILMFFLGVIGYGQTIPGISTPRTDTRRMSPEQAEYVRSQEQRQGENQQHADMLELERDRIASILPPRTKSDGKPYTKKELNEMKALLEPSPGDFDKYKDFLQQPKTGLLRLFSDFDCETKNIIRADGNCENFIPGSWSYSFRLKNYVQASFSDIRFKDKYIISDGFLTQGIMVQFGDIPLANISLQSSGMKFLTDFKPATDPDEARKQYAQIAKVVTSNSYIYSKKIKVVENATYAMRMIAYRVNIKNRLRVPYGVNYEQDKFLLLNDTDKRIDLTLVFRIVRKSDDGGITVLWKELERKNAPQIVFEKGVKLSDIK